MIAVAVTFDLPGRLRDKWFPKDLETVEQAHKQQTNAPSPKRSLEQLTERVPVDEPSEPARDMPPIEAKKNYPSQADEKSQKALIDKKIQEPVNWELMLLDLTKKTQVVPLIEYESKGVKYPIVRIIALKNIEEAYQLSSQDGLIEKGGELSISFTSIPNARLRFSLDRMGARIVLRIEAQMKLWAKKPMPFTIKKIKTEAFRTRRRADQFFVTLSALRSEKTSLEAWLNAPVAKSLQARGEAKLRVTVIGNNIKQMEGQSEAVKNEVQIVNGLEKLSQQLHKTAQLQFLVVDEE